MNDVVIFLVLMACIAFIAFGIVLFFSAILAERDRRQLAALRADCLLAAARAGVRRG